MRFGVFALLFSLLLLNAGIAFSDDTAAGSDINHLRDLILQNPENMDYRYAYANAAAQAGNMQEAARSLEYMLKKHPDLPRVKLELAVLKMRMEEYDDAKKLLNEVLAVNPPEQVTDTINKMLSAIEKESATNSFSGGIQYGIAFDTNANSASSTGQNTFIGINVPLDSTSRKQRDYHYVRAAMLAHSYKFDHADDSQLRARWNSSITVYNADYHKVNPLDLVVYAFRTGPVLALKDIGTSLNIGGGYNYVRLGDAEYLKQPAADATLSQQIGDSFMISLSGGYEDKNYTGTYDDRSGHANQGKLSLTYLLTPQDIFNVGFMLRRENTHQDYYDNDQQEISASYTRQLPWDDIVVSLGGSYKTSSYDGADPLVSSTIVRSDHEKTFSANIAVPLFFDIVWNAGYQYHNANSNIQNYAYTDHSVTTSFGWQF